MKALLISAALVGAALSTTAFAQSTSTPLNAAGVNVAPTVQQGPVADTALAQQPLTRRDVYNQLVQAEKDGSMARMDSIYYGTYWGQDVGGRPNPASAG